MLETHLPLLRHSNPGSAYWRLQPSPLTPVPIHETDLAVLARLESEAARWIKGNGDLLDELAAALQAARAPRRKRAGSK